MGSPEMSKRTHFWLRLAAVVVIAASAWIPRAPVSSSTASMQAGMQSGEAQAIHASVTSR
jgi:hypothetical protein